MVGIVVSLVCGVLMMMITDRSEALPTTMEKMTVSRMRMADLESSATGYVYDSQRGSPGSYVQYTNHGSRQYYDSPGPVQYVTYRKPGAILHSLPRVISTVPSYKSEAAPFSPGYVVPLLEAPTKPALAPYYVVPGEVHREPYHVGVHEEDHSGEGEGGDGDEVGHDHHHHDHDEREEHGGGGDYGHEEHSSHGENGEKGYDRHHEFDNGEKGEHHNEKHEGHYSDKGGNKKSHSEDTGHYGHHDEAEGGNKGESYGQQAYHKKGHKTTGFHNVYHKDEYKKDTDFYDDDHKSGHYDKHSSHEGHHSSADGGHKKGGRQDSGYAEHEQGKTGHFDKGHEHSQHNGYKSENGADSYHTKHSDYAETKGADRNKYGYSNGHP